MEPQFPNTWRQVCNSDEMMEKDGRVYPAIGRMVAVGAFGALAVAAGAFTPVGRVVLVFGAVVLLLVTGVGFAVQRHI